MQLDVAAAQIVLGVVVEAAGVRQRYAEVVRAFPRFAVISRSDGECVSRSAVDLSWPPEGPGVARPGVGSHIAFHLHSRTVVEVGELTARSCAPWFEASNEAEVRVVAIYHYEASTSHEVLLYGGRGCHAGYVAVGAGDDYPNSADSR